MAYPESHGQPVAEQCSNSAATQSVVRYRAGSLRLRWLESRWDGLHFPECCGREIETLSAAKEHRLLVLVTFSP